MRLLFILFILTSLQADSQSLFPSFLEGTWKVEGKEQYERWDKLGEKHFKGFSYSIKNGKMQMSEYLELSIEGQDVLYTANVIGQNEGKAVSFRLVPSNPPDTVYRFENTRHDFPKRIHYHVVSPDELFVEVLGEGKKGFSFKMVRQGKTGEKSVGSSNPNYDAGLAKRLGADDYGMKKFILVLLKTGENKTTEKAFIDSCFRGHMDSIGRLVKEGKLIVAGPLGKNDKTYRGIFILDVPTIKEAEELLQTDPAVKSNLLAAELYNWYGSAALREYLEASDKVWKIQP
jgi:uncharacterized protein YciI